MTKAEIVQRLQMVRSALTEAESLSMELANEIGQHSVQGYDAIQDLGVKIYESKLTVEHLKAELTKEHPICPISLQTEPERS